MAYGWARLSTSYETFRADFTENPDARVSRHWDLVILDEAQEIKNRDSEVSVRCKRLARRRAWTLTGTPLENRVEDLASVVEFTTPRGPDDPQQFLSPGPALQQRHRTVQLRRRKADVLKDLPPKTITEIVLPLEGSQRESYEQAEKDGIVQLQGGPLRIENVLVLIMRLKHICNFCPRTGASAKLNDIRSRMETLTEEGHRALLFSQFVDPVFGVGALNDALRDFMPLSYTGDMPQPRREAVLQEFQQNQQHKVLLLSLRAGGQGLNLQSASYVFHFDRWWNPAVESQAEARSHRMGQQYPVQVYKYIMEGTIEERIDKLLKAKRHLFDELVDDVTLDLRRNLTQEELFGLFGVKPPAQSANDTGADRTSASPFDDMNGQEFEAHVKELLQGKNWQVELTPISRDGGVDLIAHYSDALGIESCLWIQCKNHRSPVGVETVRALNGCLPTDIPGVRGVVACPSGFTSDARAFAKDRGILLWERHDLSKMQASETQG
jgi:SNF2 family DNA or RNA helicase